MQTVHDARLISSYLQSNCVLYPPYSIVYKFMNAISIVRDCFYRKFGIYSKVKCRLLQVFATSPDNVLSGFVSEATGVILRIRDYNSSKLLFDISRNNASQHFIMDWQSSAVIVEIQFQGYWSNRRVKIFLTSRPSKFSSFVITLRTGIA